MRTSSNDGLVVLRFGARLAVGRCGAEMCVHLVAGPGLGHPSSARAGGRAGGQLAE